MMKKTFIPFAALALLALVSCGGNSQSSSGSTSSSSSASESSVTSSSSESKSSESKSSESKSSESSASSQESKPSEESSTAPEESSIPEESSSEEPIIATVKITNKEALQAEWHVKDANRSIDLELDPKTNILAALNDGTLVIESSDPSVVMISGKNAIAIAPGSATITVKYYEATDSVDVTVADALSEPEYGQKTLSEIMAVEDLVQSGSNWYGHEAWLTQVKVGVLGKNKDGSASADKYGNMYVTDPASNEAEPELIQVYGAGASFDALTYDPAGKIYKYSNKQTFLTDEKTKEIKVGDILDVLVIRADYNTTKEISMVIRAINGDLTINGERTTDEVNATEDSANVRKQLISVTGKITGWAAGKEDGTKYGNFYLQTEESASDPVYVYGATASKDAISLNADGSLKFTNPKNFLENEGTKNLAIGDRVTLIGFRCDYNGTLELNGIVQVAAEPTPEPEAKTTIAAVTAEGDKVELAEATVAAVNNKAIGVTDGTGYIYIYLNKTPEVAVNDVVSISGTAAARNGALQLGTDTVVTKLTDKSPVSANPTVLTAAIADGWATEAYATTKNGVFTWRTTAAKTSSGYWTLNLAGSETVIEPTYMPNSFNLTEGLQYDVEALFTGYDVDHSYAAVMLISATKVEGQEVPPEPEAKTTIAEITAANDKVELAEATVAAVNTKAIGVTDGTGYIYIYLNKTPEVAVNDVVSISGTAAARNGALQLGTDTVVTKLTDKSPVSANPTVLTAAIADGWATEAYATTKNGVFTWRSTAGKTSSGYWTLNLAGSETVIEPVYTPTSFGLEEGKEYDITALFTGYDTKGSYASVMLISAEPVPEVTYHLVGNFNNWQVMDANYTFTKVEKAEGQPQYYSLAGVELPAGASLKVVGGLSAESVTWYPDGIDNNYEVTEAGKYDVLFTHEGGVVGEGWHHGFFKVEAATEPVELTKANVVFDATTIRNFNNNYTSDVTVVSEGFSYVSNFANAGQESSGWGHLRYGHKTNTDCEKGTFTTSEAFAQAVGSVDIDYTINSDLSHVDSVKLVVSADGIFDESDAVYDLGDVFATGNKKSSIDVLAPVEGAYYRLQINTTAGAGSNGFFRLNGLTFNFVPKN